MPSPPSVTVVIPVLNEERYLRACLASIVEQRYGGRVELLVVDGGSTDASVEIASSFEGVRVLTNPRRLQAPALNLALREATGEIVVRIDGHSTIADDFVERSVETLERTGAAMVGARVEPSRLGGWIARAIAASLVSPFGGGPATFRLGGQSRWTDTVFLPTFKKSTALAVGGYDESPDLNEDPEFAHRMAARGGVWYEASLRSTYAARETLRELAAQYLRYGRLRAGTARRHPRSLAPRQLAPPLFVLSLFTRRRKQALRVYSVLVLSAVSLEARKDVRAAAALPIVLPCMHFSWVAGFAFGLLRRAPEVKTMSTTD